MLKSLRDCIAKALPQLLSLALNMIDGLTSRATHEENRTATQHMEPSEVVIKLQDHFYQTLTLPLTLVLLIPDNRLSIRSAKLWNKPLGHNQTKSLVGINLKKWGRVVCNGHYKESRCYVAEPSSQIQGA